MARGDPHIDVSVVSSDTAWWVTPPSGENWGVRMVTGSGSVGTIPNVASNVDWGIGNGTQKALWGHAAASRHVMAHPVVVWNNTHEGYTFNDGANTQEVFYSSVEL